LFVIDSSFCFCQILRRGWIVRLSFHLQQIGNPTLGTVSKALELLDYFSRQHAQIGLTDFARMAGLNKATCFRLLSELQEHGLVEQIGAGREYRLGPAVLRLANLREALVPRKNAALPVLRALAQATNETAHLSIVEGDKLGMLAFAYAASHATRVTMEDAEVLPLHATSSGIAALAFCDSALRDRILAQPLRRYTENTETDPVALRARLAQVQATGIAESNATFEAEVYSFAAPLFDATGLCVGALAVAAPTSRITPAMRDEIRAALASSAAEIVALWGGNLPASLAKLWKSPV
jgi:DNA-binding IclR family transcriptional regulator